MSDERRVVSFVVEDLRVDLAVAAGDYGSVGRAVADFRAGFRSQVRVGRREPPRRRILSGFPGGAHGSWRLVAHVDGGDASKGAGDGRPVCGTTYVDGAASDSRGTVPAKVGGSSAGVVGGVVQPLSGRGRGGGGDDGVGCDEFGVNCTTTGLGPVVGEFASRGPNWERNRASREKKKRRKQARNVHCASSLAGAGRSGSAGVEHCASVVGAGSCNQASGDLGPVRGDQEGFWNSCSKEVRQELIDSKARMHIAKNLREARKAEEEVKQMESPEAVLVKAMGMVAMAEKCAKKSNDSKVAGWAQTVATSYAETIARSAPSSVPSYASVVSGSSATSFSVDGTKRVKPKGSYPGPYPDLTVKQVVDVYGLRLAESRTERDLDKIVTEVAMDDRIVGLNLKRITSVVLEKRCKFQRAAARAEIQRLGGDV